MYLWLLMSTLLNPADYNVPQASRLGTKEILVAIQNYLTKGAIVYIAKVELHIARECEADEYFLNINMYNMYTLAPGGSSLDYNANIGLTRK